MNALNPTFDIAGGDLHDAVFIRNGLERGLTCHAYDWWNVDAESLEDLDRLPESEVLHDEWRKDSELQIRSVPQGLLLVELERRQGSTSYVELQVLSHSRRSARVELSRIRELLPESEPRQSGEAKVGFWYSGNRGARFMVRELATAGWGEIARNYPDRTREQLASLMRDARGLTSGGRLVLWHGPPGTGKTSALRTLAREHRRALRIEYVLDPEAFFGKSLEYYVEVVFDEDAPADRTRLLVLEDCDELLSADAKYRSGQGLARLLNLVDGLIGQGLDLGVLITTNEPLSSFHPAVSRPGRCAAIVSFDLFAPEEAAKWLGSEVPAARNASLADLFAIAAGREPTRQPEPIGFKTPAPAVGTAAGQRGTRG